ncbi:unnamed protein product, partial [Owenia fusiformis]
SCLRNAFGHCSCILQAAVHCKPFDMEKQPQEPLGRKRKRAGTLSARLHQHFIDYLTKNIIPSKEQILKAGFRFCNEATPNTAWVPKFRAWANNLAYDDAKQKLIFIKTGKEVIPREEFYNAVMTAHFERSGKHHNGLHKTDIKVQEKYTVGRRTFGMAKQFIREVVENCPDPYCQRKKLRMKRNGSDKVPVKQESQEDDSNDDVDDIIDHNEAENLETPSQIPSSPLPPVNYACKQEQQTEFSPVPNFPPEDKDEVLVQAGDQTLVMRTSATRESDGSKKKRKKRKRKHKDQQDVDHKKPRTTPVQMKSVKNVHTFGANRQHSQAPVMPQVPYMRLPDGSMMYNIDFKSATGTSIRSIKILPKPRLTNSGPGCSNRPSQQAKSKDKRLEFFKYFQLQPKDKEKLESGQHEQSDSDNDKNDACDDKVDDTNEYGEDYNPDENNNVIVETKEPVPPNGPDQKHPLLKLGTTDPNNPGKPAFIAIRGGHGAIILRPVGHLGPAASRRSSLPAEPASVAPDSPALGDRYEKIVTLIQDMKRDILPASVGNRGSTERLKRKITLAEDLIKNKLGEAGTDHHETSSNKNNSNDVQHNPAILDVNTNVVDEAHASGPPLFQSNDLQYENILTRCYDEADNTAIFPSNDVLSISKNESMGGLNEQACEVVEKNMTWSPNEEAIDLSIRTVRGLNARAHEAAINLSYIAEKGTNTKQDTCRSKAFVSSPHVYTKKLCTSTQNDEKEPNGGECDGEIIKAAQNELTDDSDIPTSFDEVSSSTGDTPLVNEARNANLISNAITCHNVFSDAMIQLDCQSQATAQDRYCICL